ncbi:MAG: OmpA family protein [Myxococcales bacterium]|nr:OmpA family protein [Myxococcales bacterium]
MSRCPLLLVLALAACSVGVVPRDLPPPEPAADSAPEPAPDPLTPTPAADPPARRDYTLDGNRLVLPAPLAFDGDKLKPESDPALEHARSYLTDKDYITTMRVEGHADDQALSERRAVAVARWLVARGVDCKRLIAVGFGPTKPVAAAGAPENTRVELHNAALRDRPIGGAPLNGGGNPATDDLCR